VYSQEKNYKVFCIYQLTNTSLYTPVLAI